MEGYVATIGMFDGVHCGHQFVLRHVVDEAQRRGLQSMAVTFDRQGAPMLTPLADKLRLLTQCGIERTEVLAFDDTLKQLTARQFMADVLKERYGVRVLMIGYDNRFGHNRAEGFDDYVRYGRELGIDVLQLPAEGIVCSSMIRQLLADGDVAAAAEALGRAYTVSGRVVHGEHVGTQMGFPTANLVPDCATQLLPAPGVYAVRVGSYGGMMNIGTRPTFDGNHQTLEVNIFDFDGNLYGSQISVSFVERLRDEQHFDSPEALAQQLQIDSQQAKEAIRYLLFFIAIQLIGGTIIQTIWTIITGSVDKTAPMLITTTAVVGVLTIIIFLWARYALVSPSWLRTRPWTVLTWSVVAALGALIPSAWIQEQMPELPNLVENEFDTIMGTPWGYLVIGLLAPLSEEIVLRGAVLRQLLCSSRLSTWGAITLSAVFFALIHMNPAQMPHAFAIGLLLGWMYWRTGSILPGVAYHWANNSVAFVLYAIYPNPDIKLIDVFQGSQLHVYMALFFSMLIFLPALYQLHVWMRRAE